MKNKLLLIAMGFALTTQMISAQVPSYLPTNGIVAYYPFNGNANDQSGNGHNGTDFNGAILSSDRFGNLNSAYSFDGINDYISANIGNYQAISVSLWVDSSNPIQWYPIVAMYAQYMNFIGMTGNNPIYISNGIVGNIHTEYLPANPNHIQTNFNLSFNTWHHVVVVFDNSISKYELYVDNNLIGSATTTGVLAPNSSIILFGNSTDGVNADGGGGFKGSIDDIGVWNRALTHDEITSLYYSENTCQSLVINTGVLSFNPPTYNNTVTIYPNPANDHITIDCGNLANVSGWTIKIVNTLGQEVFSGAMNTQQYVVPLNSWSGQGVYFVKIYDASNNLINTKKIILQ